MLQDRAIKALLVSPGQFSGKVAHFSNNQEVNRYQGKVVVMRDIDASEIIVKISRPAGVITEVGGITAHGALLLREYGVPAVVLPRALTILRPGAQVQLDSDGVLHASGKSIGQKQKKSKRRPVLCRRGVWTMVKPRRPEDVFTANTKSFAGPGFVATPRVLLGKSMKSVVRYTPKGIWVKNHPLPDEIAEKVLSDNKWFSQHVRAERTLFEKLKRYERRMKKKLQAGYSCTLRKCYAHASDCRNWFTKARPYVYLFADAVEVLQRNFVVLTERFLTQTEAAQVYSLTARSAYAKAIKRYQIRDPRPAKGAMLAYQPFNLVSAVPNIKRRVRLPRNITNKLERQPIKFQNLYQRYLEVMPIMSELNDEMCYVPRQIISAIPFRFLLPIAETAVKLAIFKDKNELLDLSYDEIRQLVAKLIKKQAQLRTQKFKIAP